MEKRVAIFIVSLLVIILISASFSFPMPTLMIAIALLLLVLITIITFRLKNWYLLRKKRNLFEFIAYYNMRGEVKVEFNEIRSQTELFELLWNNGLQIRSNPFGRDMLRKELSTNPKVFSLCIPYMFIAHPISGVPRYFNGLGEEVIETEYLKSEIMISFELGLSGERDLLKLLKLKSKEKAEVPIEGDKNTIDELFKKAFAFKGSSEYKKFFSFIAKFNHYARYNSMLVYIQNPNVTFFGTSYYWRTKFQRTINETAKPHIILAPGGPVILAYDIFDTSGKQTPEEFLKNGFNLKLFDVKGEFKKEYLTTLKAYATKYEIKVTYKPMSFFQGGAVTTYITKKLEIYLREGNDERQHFSTLCHELAHIFLGHTGHKVLITENRKTRLNLPERTALSLKQEELEAETVNFLICKKLGLEAKSMEYLAGYIESEADWKNFSYELVIKVADRLEGELK